jgi:hypothetical protein
MALRLSPGGRKDIENQDSFYKGSGGLMHEMDV